MSVSISKDPGKIRYVAMPTSTALAIRSGAVDANGKPAESMVSDGGGYPCRHCLRDIPQGERMLLFSWKPLESRNPYAESGPVFICEGACERYAGQGELPPVIASRPCFMIRGYDAGERIVGGSGRMVSAVELDTAAGILLGDGNIQSVHVRSVTNTCYTCRIERA